MPIIRLQYFAILRDQRGEASETLETKSGTAGELYAELKSNYNFPLSVDRLRVAVNGEFSEMDTTLQDQDEVVFIPPVAGG